MAEFNLGFADEETVREISAARNEPPWLLASRLKALESFKRLPIEDHPLFTKLTDIARARVGECVPFTAPSESSGEAESDVRVAGAFKQSGGSAHTVCLDPSLEEKGVILETLQDAVSRHPQLLKKVAFDHATLPARDKFAQMSKALWTNGLFIHIPDCTSLEKPFVIGWSAGRGNSALLSRTIVSMGKDSSAKMVEEILPGGDSSDSAGTMFGGTVEAVVGDGSVLNCSSLENLGTSASVFLNRHADIGEGSEAHWALGYVGGEMVRARADNLLRGRAAKVREVQVLYGDKAQFFDLFSHTRHLAEDTVSDLLSKGVLQARSKAYAKGLITIERGGKGSDSYLGEFGMVLSRDARFLSIPSLEIENHAVKRAKHSSSVAQIDERQVFYLMSRGIDESEARKMIVMGFLEPVVESIPVESVAERLRGLFQAKWAG